MLEAMLRSKPPRECGLAGSRIADNGDAPRAHDLDDHDAETTCVPAGRGAAHYGRAFARQTLRQHGPALEDYASALEGPRPLGDDSVRKLAWLGRVTCLRALGDDGEARQAACAGLDEGEDMMLRRALDELTRRQG